MKKITIRQANIADVDAIRSVIKDAYAVYVGNISDLPDVVSGLQDDIQNNVVFIASLDQEIIAGMILIEETDHIKLANIAVSRKAAGRGVARKLLERAEQHCKSRGLNEMRLNTHKEMALNVQIYEHLGWSVVDVKDSKISMRKRI